MTKRRAISAVLCCLTFLLSAGLSRAAEQAIGPCPGAGATEQGAVELALPVACRGTFATSSPHWFGAQLARGQRVIITVTPEAPQFATTLSLKDPSSVPSSSSCSGQSTDTNSIDSCDLLIPTSGLWKLAIAPDAGLGSYHLTIEATPAQTDCGTGDAGGDAPEEQQIGSSGVYTAIPLTLSPTEQDGERQVVCIGYFNATPDSEDWYSVPVALGARITATAKPDPIIADGPDGPVVGPASRVQSLTIRPPSGGGKPVDSLAPPATVTMVATVGGTYYIGVKRGAAAYGGQPYRVSITTEQRDCLAAPDTEGKNEVSDDPASPFALTGATSVTCLGSIDDTDTSDWFNVKLTKDGTVGIDSTPGLCHTMRVWAPGTNLAGAPTSTLATCDGSAVKSFTASTDGVYTIQVVKGSSPLTSDASEVYFDDTDRDQLSKTTKEITITTSVDNIKIDKIEIVGRDNKDFLRIAGGTCAENLVLGTSGGRPRSCTVDLRFRPAGEGARAAFLAITSGDTKRQILLGGNGLPATLGFSDASLTFADTNFGSKSPTKTITITNVSPSSTLLINRLSFQGAHAADFAVALDKDNKLIDTCSNRQLNPGQSCTADLTFSPRGNGTRTGQLVISSGSVGTVDLSGKGNAPILAVDAVPDFSSAIGIGQTQNVKIRNTGQFTMSTIDYAVSGANFSKTAATDGNACTGSLAPGAVCSAGVKYLEAVTPDVFTTGSVTVTSNAPNSPVTQPLKGSATATGAAPVLNPIDELDFPDTVHGALSTLPLRIQNKGAASFTLTSIALTPPTTKDFVAPSTGSACKTGTVVAAGVTCLLDLDFTPSRVGARAASLTLGFTSSQAGQTLPSQTILLVGRAISEGGHLVVISDPAFPATRVGTSSPRRDLVLENSGTAAVKAVTVTSDSSLFAARASTCGASLGAKKRCTVSVTFEPVKRGSACAVLTISSDDPAGPITRNACATGVAPGLTVAAPVFAPVTVGQASGLMDLVLTNKDALPVDSLDSLVISSITVTNNSPDTPDFAVSSDGCTDITRPSGAAAIAKEGSCAVRFVFVPRDAGMREATIDIRGNFPAGLVTLTLSGFGSVAPSALIGHGGAYTVSATGVNFAQPVVGDCALVNGTGDPVLDAADVRPGQELTGASPFTCTGHISGAADKADFFAVPGVAPTDIVHVTTDTTGIEICQYDKDGNKIRSGNGSCALDHRIDAVELDPAKNLWSVSVTAPADVEYTFTVTIYRQSDCGLNKDAANDLPEAQDAAYPALDATTPFVCSAPATTGAPGNTDGDLSDPTDGIDIFKVQTGTAAATAGALVVTFTPTLPPDIGGGTDIDVIVHAPDGTTTASGQNGGSGQPEVVVAHCGEQTNLCVGGTWYVEIRYIRGAQGTPPAGTYKMAIAGRTI